MIVNNKRNSVKDLEVQGDRPVGPEDGMNDSSPKKKRSRRLPGRSKSLVDDTASDRKQADANRNMGRYKLSYLRRAPTQDDIYKILTETSDSIRPSTGKVKRLSPYAPLPAIGTKIKPPKDSDSKVQETLGSSSVTSHGDCNQKLVREGTYNVLEPKFVKGPIVCGVSGKVSDNSEENKSDERSKKAVDQLKLSSATTAFGPGLPKQEKSIIEEDLTVTDLLGQQGHENLSTTLLNTGVETETHTSANQIKSITMQKLYYRGDQKSGSQQAGIALTSINAEH
jgi:hypothetical protein